ncbi:type III secretion system gatekeeper subunit SctW [Thalassoglobus sp. JC818]|uniref:type III secretion system gatekeeper subunit SctW n=1 Tax=Thalassoglobus sp. JC818 TaxID=3232136 RepID=UPI0034589329
MQPGIEGNKMAVLGGLQNATWQLSAAMQGSHRGQAVTILPGASATNVQDSLEELTFTLHESESKKLAERTTQSKSFASRLHALLAKYVTALPETLSPDEFSQYADFLRRLSQPNPQDLERLLQEKFGDDTTSQVTTLEALEELFSNGDHPVALKTVQELKQKWRDTSDYGPLVKAGENVAATATEFEAALAPDLELRDFYRETVLSWSSLDDAYSSILNQFGGESFSTATDFLFQALGCEMQSLGPSCDPRMLSAIRDDIYFLQVVRRFYEDVLEITDRIEETFGITLCKPRKTKKRQKRSSRKFSR